MASVLFSVADAVCEGSNYGSMACLAGEFDEEEGEYDG